MGARWLAVETRSLRWIDGLTALLGRDRGTPEHLRTGLAGEREALLYLRRAGHIVVAERWTTGKLRGDLDLVTWEAATLCFVEVKTRREYNPADPAEAAVDHDKQRTLRALARAYLRNIPEPERTQVPVRFDVVSVYLDGPEPRFEHLRGAFPMRAAHRHFGV